MAKSNYTSPPNVDAVQASYWNGSLTRGEAQKVFDHQAEVIAQLQAVLYGKINEKGEQADDGVISTLQKIDITLAMMLDKLGYTVADVQAFMVKMQEEYATLRAADPAPEPAEPSRIIL